MGLDMYLKANINLCGTSWAEKNEKTLHKKVKNIFHEMYDSGNLNSIDISFEVGYWRKANQIHKWFVDNVQEGKDNCATYHVSREELKKLLSLCEEVIKNPEKANDFLPTKDGFFFGNTEYDGYYLADIIETIKIIKRCLKLSDEWEFQYHSSW